MKYTAANSTWRERAQNFPSLTFPPGPTFHLCIIWLTGYACSRATLTHTTNAFLACIIHMRERESGAARGRSINCKSRDLSSGITKIHPALSRKEIAQADYVYSISRTEWRAGYVCSHLLENISIQFRELAFSPRFPQFFYLPSREAKISRFYLAEVFNKYSEKVNFEKQNVESFADNFSVRNPLSVITWDHKKLCSSII
jgi:hypothetical protein